MHSEHFTLNALYASALARFGDRSALRFDGTDLTYRQLLKQGYCLANALISQGIESDDRVALVMSNCTEFAIAEQGIIHAGAARVALNNMLGQAEMLYILADSNARVAVVGEEFFDLIANNRHQLPELEVVIGLAPPDRCPDGFRPWDDVIVEGDDRRPLVAVSPDNLAILAYTGGTTGQPKGVVHTQRTMCLNMLAHVIELGLQDDEKLLLTSPLPHSAGFLMLAGLIKGATHFVERRFDPEQVVTRISHQGITLTFMVPTMIYRILDWIGDRQFDLGSLRTILYGAAPITEDRLRQGLALLGPVFMQLYGQSEAPNFVTRLCREDHRPDPGHAHRLRSCGQPTAMAEVKILAEDGQEVATGDVGELVVRTPFNMVGYHGLPEKTAGTLIDGWLRTGDIARQDDAGYVYLLDRKNDMIITGGMNVYTTEVENAIQDQDGVGQVAVVGIPDDDWGEAVTAFIVPVPGTTLTGDCIIQHCRQTLSKYKVPKKVVFIEALPVTAFGKTDKKILRQHA